MRLITMMRTTVRDARYILSLAMAVTALALLPWTAAAAERTPSDTRGLPFSAEDLGWLAVGAALVLLLALALHALSKPSRTRPLGAARRRTDP